MRKSGSGGAEDAEAPEDESDYGDGGAGEPYVGYGEVVADDASEGGSGADAEVVDAGKY